MWLKERQSQTCHTRSVGKVQDLVGRTSTMIYFFSPTKLTYYFENLGCIKLLKENCIHQLYQNYINSNVIFIFDVARTSSWWLVKVLTSAPGCVYEYYWVNQGPTCVSIHSMLVYMCLHQLTGRLAPDWRDEWLKAWCGELGQESWLWPIEAPAEESPLGPPSQLNWSVVWTNWLSILSRRQLR